MGMCIISKKEILALGEYLGCNSEELYSELTVLLNKHCVTLVKDFTEEQRELAAKLLNELEDTCHELEEFSTLQVYGLLYRGKEKTILVALDYSDPEGKGATIFCNY